MEVARLVLREPDAAQVICLKEVSGSRILAIPIGLFEANYICHRVRGRDFPRPLSHDLLAETVAALGAELKHVRIGDCRQQTWYATLHLEREGNAIEVDCRPSDAIALALSSRPAAPIYVAQRLLAQPAAT